MNALVTLFLVSFAAATLFPAYSELMVAGMLKAGHQPLTLWSVATLGNTLGSAVNWVLGRYMLRFQDRRWFPFKEKNLGRAQRWFNRYGVWALLMAWLPVGGDALTFIAGLMRVRFGIFFVLTAIGKGLRYALLLGLLQGLASVFGL